MGKKRKPNKNDPKQFQRFVEAARDLVIDESGKAFERAIDVISDHLSEKKKPTSRSS